MRCVIDLGLEKPILDQFIYSYAINRIDANGVRAFCETRRGGHAGLSPMAQGLLTGKYRDGVPTGSRISKARRSATTETEKIYEQNKARIDHSVNACHEFQVKGGHAALQWCSGAAFFLF